jgi:hypothetical protein
MADPHAQLLPELLRLRERSTIRRTALHAGAGGHAEVVGGVAEQTGYGGSRQVEHKLLPILVISYQPHLGKQSQPIRKQQKDASQSESNKKMPANQKTTKRCQSIRKQQKDASQSETTKRC